MVDIHTHILPGLDDGASDIYDTIEMAELAYESGTTVIVATPHCNLPGLYANYFGREYSSTFIPRAAAASVLDFESSIKSISPGGRPIERITAM